MKIDTNSVRNKSEKLSKYIENINSVKTKLNGAVSEIDGAWKGKKATKFVSDMNDIYIKELGTLANYLEKYQNYLEKVPKAYEMLDEDYGSKKIL